MQKIVFIGTTEFGIPTLEKLKKDYELVLVITQPDKPAGRNKTLTSPPVKIWAEKNKIPIEQPEKISNLKSIIYNLKSDLAVVAAYGQIIPKEILDLPRLGSINIHGSLLPKYRGASPIQSAILNGDVNTGITLIQMDEKMDHGPILGIQPIILSDNETFPALYKKLSLVAADLVSETLPKLFVGQIQPREQNHTTATFCKQMSFVDAKIDWAKPASEIDRMVRALNPEPGTWTKLNNKVIKILEVELNNEHKIELPGKLYILNGQLAVKCLDGSLVIKKIKPDGKNEMSGKDFLNGLKTLSDKIFI